MYNLLDTYLLLSKNTHMHANTPIENISSFLQFYSFRIYLELLELLQFCFLLIYLLVLPISGFTIANWLIAIRGEFFLYSGFLIGI